MQSVFNRGGMNTTVGSNQPNLTKNHKINRLLLCLQHSCGSGRHTIDAPVGVAVFVANGNGKPAIVGSYH